MLKIYRPKSLCLYIFFILFFIQTYSFSQIDSAFISNRYKQIAERIIKASGSDSSAWQRMAYMCDTFGPRFSGTQNLEDAIKWIKDEMTKDGLSNVHLGEVKVPHWKRGNEYCKLISPREAIIPILGLGGSIATPREGITAPVLVVSNFDELGKRQSEAKGKIVIFDIPFTDYGQTVQYRTIGAIKAAQFGAVASIIRSVSPIGMQNPHTGQMRYTDTVPKIPSAAITGEYTAMLHRMQARGQNPAIKLYMEAETLPDAISHNLMCELPGRELPNEFIAAGGHIDSWDVGTGAQDDGGACIAIWQSVKLLKELGLQPRRTIRCALWTNEENGVMGGKTYAQNHKEEKHVLMFEFDSGIFPPSELRYKGYDSLGRLLGAFLPLINMIKPVKLVEGWVGVDIRYMMDLGVPGMSIETKDEGKYFWYHHSPTDTPDKIDPKDMNECVAVIALSLYMYADLPGELPSQLDAVHHSTK